MLLLCADAIFKLARRHTQLVRRDRRMGPPRPSRLRLRADMNGAAVV